MTQETNIIKIGTDNTLTFGDFQSDTKQKFENFLFEGNSYNIRTYKETTRLTKNKELLLETVPGSLVHNFHKEAGEAIFDIQSFADTNITVQLEPDTIYRVTAGKNKLGSLSSGISGKLSFALDLTDGKSQTVRLEKAS